MSTPASAPGSLADRKDVRTIYLLKRAETAVKGRLEAVLGDLGVTPGQYTTLTLLRTRREVSSAELARQAGVTPQSISETIAVLDRRGWIERSESPANRRVLRIGLTPAGEALVRSCDVRVERMERALLASLDAGVLRQLRESLAAVLHAASATPDAERPAPRGRVLQTQGEE